VKEAGVSSVPSLILDEDHGVVTSEAYVLLLFTLFLK